MTLRQTIGAITGAALFLAAGTGLADEYLITNSAPTAETLRAGRRS